MKTLDTFTRAYITAALWTSRDDNGAPMDSTYSIEDMAEETIARAVADCEAFRTAAGALLADWPEDLAGHDFWLTRCGHGAGFWDRGYPNGDELTALVGFRTAFDNVDLYVGDDNKLYFA